ncbi:MAG TPA: CHAP domain-containing protein [Acetobacteraceae bacterium]|jgi:surface antigen|nr:CHAP domain-containing protein [Acetobacteraceae bacterium]
MRAWGTGATILTLGSILSFSSPLTARPAQASPSHDGSSSAQPIAPTRSYAGGNRSQKVAPHASTALRGRHYYAGGGGISCVPFARSDSGISVPGNAWQWWENAAGVYQRGRVPEPGSVLTFRANGRMYLGHVAVVSRVINPREVEVEHANWAGTGMRGGVARNVPVVDVSEANDWTAVRVGLGRGGEFGSVYPTYGFIYDRPDSGTLVAAARTPTPKPALNPVPADLRPAPERGWQMYEEVAEAPKALKRHRRGIDLSLNHASVTDAPIDPKQ